MAAQQIRMGLVCGCVTFLCLRGVLFEWIHNLHSRTFGSDEKPLLVYNRRAMEFDTADRMVHPAADFNVVDDERIDAGRFKLLWAEELQRLVTENKVSQTEKQKEDDDGVEEEEEELLQRVLLENRRSPVHGDTGAARFGGGGGIRSRVLSEQPR